MRASPFLLHVVNYDITKFKRKTILKTLFNIIHSAVKGSHIKASKPLRTKNDCNNITQLIMLLCY